MNESQIVFYHLGVALAIGLLIGTERGWKQRDAEEGDRIAGLRTYGLLGLLGGVSAQLSQFTGAWHLGLMFVGIALLLGLVYQANLKADNKDVGITSLIAALLTFSLGALAAKGEVALAAASAVVVTLLLSYKSQLHRWVQVLEHDELSAGIKLLVISLVVLPVLPNQSFGPWQSLNPFNIWWMVVLISAISFVGYFAIKLGGTRNGAALAGLFAGLASSTALTLHFSKLAKKNEAIVPAMSTGILLACGTMFPRTLLVAGVINPKLLGALWVPFLIMALITYPPAITYWKTGSGIRQQIDEPAIKNPLALTSAVGFGLLLTLILLLGSALNAWYGDQGVLALAAISGISDVDAITLSLARMSSLDLGTQVAAGGIVLAAAVNNVVKGLLATTLGGQSLGLRVGLPLLVSACAGLTAAWLWFW